jgi:predicted oxidoreductase (fatty acid repression mutant protein)
MVENENISRINTVFNSSVSNIVILESGLKHQQKWDVEAERRHVLQMTKPEFLETK